MTKIATDIEQSKILKDILPLDSHDMYYEAKNGDLSSEFNLFVGQDIAILKNLFSYRFGYTIPAWSLNALLDILPYTIKDHNDRNFYFKLESVENDAGHRGYNIQYYQDVECYLMTMYDYDSPIDACYEMIVKLHEKGLL